GPIVPSPSPQCGGSFAASRQIPQAHRVVAAADGHALAVRAHRQAPRNRIEWQARHAANLSGRNVDHLHLVRLYMRLAAGPDHGLAVRADGEAAEIADVLAQGGP